MSVRIRAKFQCQEETRRCWGDSDTRVYKFGAVYDPNQPEDQGFSKYTPSASLEMTVDKPTATFDVGAFYYLDFVPVEAATEAANA